MQEGDLVGVIKQQDPMGSYNRWLVDNGGERVLYVFTPHPDVTLVEDGLTIRHSRHVHKYL